MQNRRTIHKFLGRWLLLLWPLLAFSSCVLPTPPAVTPLPGGTPTAPPVTVIPTATVPITTTPAGTASALAGTSWQLVSYGGSGAETPVIAGSTITLTFGVAGEVGGFGGCNTYGGAYTVQETTLTLRDIVSTLRACVDQTVTEQEVGYLAALQATGRFAITADTLTIWYDNERSVLTFTRAASSAPLEATPAITPSVPITATAVLTA